MALRFVFGASGSGKSFCVQEELIQQSVQNRDTNFLMIVPDQFTMQTQKQMATRHPNRGILNIDVLSFKRLAYRIFSEVGRDSRVVLDDTGKCLLLRKVAGEHRNELTAIGRNLQRAGYIQEVKSVLSEFMQYGIDPQGVAEMAEYAKAQRTLYARLKDFQLLYEAFEKECEQKYLTKEETLDLLRERLKYSNLIKQSVIIFDGFTGFTPIQNRVIQELMVCAKEVVVTIPIDTRYEPYRVDGDDFLFQLSQKTIRSLQKLAQEAGISCGNDRYFLDKVVYRFRNNAEMSHLERNLFRTAAVPYEGNISNIEITQAGQIREECKVMCDRIFKLIHQEQYRYRDIAVVTGDMLVYEDALREQFEKYSIPYFMDTTVSLVQNPMVEYIKGFLSCLLYNFSYRDMFHMLRSSMTDLTIEEIDLLENYVRARGINHRKDWEHKWIYSSREISPDPCKLDELNTIRDQILSLFEEFDSLLQRDRNPAEQWALAMYRFLVKSQLEQKMSIWQKDFEEKGDLARAKEYSQIYKLIMDLLNQIVELLHTEEISLREFYDILDAGFGEIRIGTLPQNVDHIVVGDIERTRLKEIKAMFFLGVNDGIIPKSTAKGGIISDMERKYLMQSGKELAPTPNDKMFIQKLYLYLNLTKPSEKLYLSYASVGEDGNSLRPAYLIATIQKLFPQLKVKQSYLVLQNLSQNPYAFEEKAQISSIEDAREQIAKLLRDYSAGCLDEKQEEYLFMLYSDLCKRPECEKWLKEYENAAFSFYTPSKLEQEIAQKLYGKIVACSISSLERFASCEYAHYLAYGLKLSEREEYGFEGVDMGNVTHEVLEKFGSELANREMKWIECSEDDAIQILEDSIDKVTEEYKGALLYDGAKNRYLIHQLKRIMKRTVTTLQTQLSKGSFTPVMFEAPFRKLYDITNDHLAQETQLMIRGKIDRIDTMEDGTDTFVKIVDYKSGSKKFDLNLFYYGITLQLAIYLGQALEMVRRDQKSGNAIPAAMLYYRISDPIIQTDALITKEKLEELMLKDLCQTGIVVNKPQIIENLDSEFCKNSSIIPVAKDKMGEIRETESVMDPIFMDRILEFAQKKALELGKKIVSGEIAHNPYETKASSACDYCAYASACGYDSRIDGYQKRNLDGMDKESLIAKIRGEKEVLGENEQSEGEEE